MGVTRTDFESTFHYEILKSEQRRVLLIITVVSAIVGSLVVNWIMGTAPELMGAGRHLHLVILLLSLLVAYEILAYLAFGWFLKRRKEPPVFGRMANAFIETGVPFLAMFIFGLDFSPAEALVSPPAFVYFFFILLSILRLNFWLCLWTGFIAASGYTLYLFLYLDVILSSSVPLFQIFPIHLTRIFTYLGAGVLAGFIANEVKNRFLTSLRTIEERNEIINIFGKHVSPEVVNKLLSQDHEMQSELRHVCVLFLDIRNFTAFSEKRTPAEVVQFLNNTFEFMIEIINRNNGIINKFLGDGFMAVFGAPVSEGRDCDNAVNAAGEIITELRRRIDRGELPQVRIGIGIHAGETITGNVGSSRRREYTIIGDTVNVASRIEALNKEVGSELLISGAVREALTLADDWFAVDSVTLRGRQGTLSVFRPGSDRLAS
ncbi:MAG: adenylate/guanylate cyclase domain-containing protein [Spirochaetales bacterium]|nr:adenylate/guanylate cyclase domain-containing protein [Spirochaetales bacterium]